VDILHEAKAPGEACETASPLCLPARRHQGLPGGLDKPARDEGQRHDTAALPQISGDTVPGPRSGLNEGCEQADFGMFVQPAQKLLYVGV
jgi:hypothetical protein